MPLSLRRRLRGSTPLSLSAVILALAHGAAASSPLPPTQFAPPHAVSWLAGPYVLWSIVERNGSPVRIECAVQLTDGDLSWARTIDGSGPGTMADPFFVAETAGGQTCTEPVFKAQGIESAIVGGWSIGMGGSVRLLQANAAPMDFRPGMVAGEYALEGGKVYLTALRAPSTLFEIASPLGGPGFGYEATSPAGWTSTLDPATAALTVTAPGTATAPGNGDRPDPALWVLPVGQAACFVTRTPIYIFGTGERAKATQDELNALAREIAGRPDAVIVSPTRAPNLKVEAVERGSIVGIKRTWTGPGEGEPLTLLELEWQTPGFSVVATCGAGASADDPLGVTISDFINALKPDER